ncbi:MAG: hypothetical protein WBH50_21480, partial [Fuerstiella sp.]
DFSFHRHTTIAAGSPTGKHHAGQTSDLQKCTTELASGTIRDQSIRIESPMKLRRPNFGSES